MPSRAALNSARLYDLAYYWQRPRDDQYLGFLTSILQRHAPGRRVLDCACGTGQPGIDLLGRFAMTFADASQAMLRLAKEKGAAKGFKSLSFHRVYWSELGREFVTPFDAVLCCGNAITQSPTLAERKAALQGMTEVLAPGGLLYLDFWEGRRDPNQRRFRAVEVIGPLFWQRRSLLFVIYERWCGPILIRQKVCYSIRGARLCPAASASSRYCPFTREELRGELAELGLDSIHFSQCPGRWNLTAVTARKKRKK